MKFIFNHLIYYLYWPKINFFLHVLFKFIGWEWTYFLELQLNLVDKFLVPLKFIYIYCLYIFNHRIVMLLINHLLDVSLSQSLCYSYWPYLDLRVFLFFLSVNRTSGRSLRFKNIQFDLLDHQVNTVRTILSYISLHVLQYKS